MKELYEYCPRFNHCSAPICPLDSNQNLRSPKMKGEESCKVRKSIRLRIAKDHPDLKLPYLGYTSREFAGKRGGNQVKNAENQALNAVLESTESIHNLQQV